jgi:tetratricopeptide (TPR) repeat protein
VKPLGTITACFPHVDEDTRSMLQSVMDEAKNYADFTNRLCEKACSEMVPPVLHYFAFFHAWNLDMYPQMERLFSLDDSPIFIEPLYLSSKVILGYEVDMKEMYMSLVKAMETIPNDWLACHLYLTWRRVVDSFDPESDTDTYTMETLRERIENDEDFDCFKALLIGLDAFGMTLKGYRAESINLYREGIEIARKHDDLALVADGLYFLAETIKKDDISQAMDLMLEQKKIGEELGYAWALARYLLVIGRIMNMRGEYDGALKHLQEFRKTTHSVGHPESLLNMSDILTYNLMGNGKKALEYLEKAKGRIDGRKRNMAFYYLHLAFALMNNEDESRALKALDAAKQLGIQSGNQYTMNMHQLLEGIFEKKRGDFLTATNTLENLLIQIGKENHIHKTLCYFHLADIEVETYSSEQIGVSESWLHRFESFTEERNYPGFKAQAKILRAKLLHKQGEDEKSQKLIDEVLQVAESPKMMYLKNMIATYIPEISTRSK